MKNTEVGNTNWKFTVRSDSVHIQKFIRAECEEGILELKFGIGIINIGGKRSKRHRRKRVEEREEERGSGRVNKGRRGVRRRGKEEGAKKKGRKRGMREIRREGGKEGG